VLNGARIRTVKSIGSISERQYLAVIRFEQVPNGRCFYFEHYNHKRTHQKGAVGLFVEFVGAVVEQFIIFIRWVSKETNKFSDKFVDHCKVKRPKVVVERVIH